MSIFTHFFLKNFYHICIIQNENNLIVRVSFQKKVKNSVLVIKGNCPALASVGHVLRAITFKIIATMKNDQHSYLSFQINREIFAIDVIKVLEVLQMTNITCIPKTADYVKGVINFRGEIIPVIDSRAKFGMEILNDTSKSVIIILNFQKKDKTQIIGVIVDSVMDVINLEYSQVKDVPEMGSRYNLDFISGMIKIDEEFVMLLDVDKVFSVDELSIISEAAEVYA